MDINKVIESGELIMEAMDQASKKHGENVVTITLRGVLVAHFSAIGEAINLSPAETKAFFDVFVNDVGNEILDIMSDKKRVN